MKQKRKPLILGIAGGSCSGKTDFVTQLCPKIGIQNTAVIGQDSFYLDRSSLPNSERNLINYDHPSALDTELFETCVLNLLNGNDTAIPVYDFSSHTRLKGAEKLLGLKQYIIIEGSLVLAIPSIRELLDVRIFLNTPPEVRLIRRLRRDPMQFSIPFDASCDYYLNYVLPMYEDYVQPSMKYANFTFSWSFTDTVVLDTIAGFMSTVLLER